MAKYLNIGFVRELELKLNREEISYSKMVELMEEECIKNYKKETFNTSHIKDSYQALVNMVASKSSKISSKPSLSRYMKEFTWNEETIDYFAELYDSNGWAHVSQRALAFVLDDCEVQDDETYQDLFGDLINKIEDKVNKEEYEWLEAKLQEKELD